MIDAELQNRLYKLHPTNIVRIELNRDEPGDGDINDAAANHRYSRAAKFLKNWRSEGVLYEDSQPAVYVYHQVFEAEGKTHTRRGFMVRCRLERFGEGKIYPHEETLSGPKADRLLLTRGLPGEFEANFWAVSGCGERGADAGRQGVRAVGAGRGDGSFRRRASDVDADRHTGDFRASKG